MIVHDEDTLQQALSLVEQGPVRYSDEYAYVIVSSPGSLKKAAGTALERGDIVVVVPVGQEYRMEDHAKERPKVLERRKRRELKDVRKWISEHPELKEAKTEREMIESYRKGLRDRA